MELFEVTFDYSDLLSRPITTYDPAWIAPRKTVTTYAVVHGEYGGAMISAACRVALAHRLGAEWSNGDWNPVVTGAKYLGSCMVQEAAELVREREGQ